MSRPMKALAVSGSVAEPALQRVRPANTARAAAIPHLFDLSDLLLELDPEIPAVVELVDSPVVLAQDQFEALLVDSECEV